jgi:hypothetical protein
MALARLRSIYIPTFKATSGAARVRRRLTAGFSDPKTRQGICTSIKSDIGSLISILAIIRATHLAHPARWPLLSLDRLVYAVLGCKGWRQVVKSNTRNIANRLIRRERRRCGCAIGGGGSIATWLSHHMVVDRPSRRE